MNVIRVLVADDHALVRAGLAALLHKAPGVNVIAEARNGHETLALMKEHQPDVALVDVAMPGPSGLDVAELARREFPGVRVLILSMHNCEEYVRRAMRAGAAGYLLKDAATAELELAVRAADRGETYLSPAVARTVVEGFNSAQDAGVSQLTPRQQQILRLIAEGQSTKAIARTLKISPKTVETHRAQLMNRLDIHEVAGLVRYALRAGLVPADWPR